MKDNLNPTVETLKHLARTLGAPPTHDRMTCPVCQAMTTQERERARERASERVRVKRALRRLLIARGIPVPDAHVMDWLIQYVEGGK